MRGHQASGDYMRTVGKDFEGQRTWLRGTTGRYKMTSERVKEAKGREDTLSG
jgi:hypothetical protein